VCDRRFFRRPPDLAPDHSVAGRTISADPPNRCSECKFGGVTGMARRPAGLSGLRPGPAGPGAEPLSNHLSILHLFLPTLSSFSVTCIFIWCCFILLAFFRLVFD
jgi:hypothetical protein